MINKDELFQDLLQNGIPNSHESQIFSTSSDQDLEENQKLEKKAYNYAIRILAKRDYSVFKMKQKLKERSFESDIIDKVVSTLVEQNYLRENEYIRMRIKHLLIKGYANPFIHRKLEQEKLKANDEMINQLREENALTTHDTLIRLVEKKLRNKPIPNEFNQKMKLKAKVSNFLISKGYSFDEINSALSEYLK